MINPLMSDVPTGHSMKDDLMCARGVIDFWAKGPPFRVVIGLTCVLSIIGSLLIIFSYVFFKSLRNRARLILVHLSVVDLGVGLANLFGNLVYFDRFYFSKFEIPNDNLSEPFYQTNDILGRDLLSYGDDHATDFVQCVSFHQPNNTAISNLCIAQAFIAHFFTQASILWTISLAVFLYFLIVHNTTQLAKYSLRTSYVLCYALPLLVCGWLLYTKRFGYSPTNTGWCSILIIDAESSTPDVYAAVFGYDMWTYLGMTLVPILYLAVQLYVREKLKQTKLYLPQAEGRFWEAVYILDYKFLLIPVVFTLLRMWTCIVDLVFVYMQVRTAPLWVNIAFVYLAGVGDSAQGAANAILFVLLTKRVRRTIFSLSYWKYKLNMCQNIERCENGEDDPLLTEKMVTASRTVSKQSQSSYPESEIFTPARVSLSESLPNVFQFPVTKVN